MYNSCLLNMHLIVSQSCGSSELHPWVDACGGMLSNLPGLLVRGQGSNKTL